MVEKIQHGVARAAGPDALGREDDRTIDQNRMFQHRGKQRVVVHRKIKQAQLLCRGLRHPQGGARRKACGGEQRQKLRAGLAGFEKRNDDRRLARRLDDCQHVARGAAVGIVMDDDGHADPSLGNQC